MRHHCALHVLGWSSRDRNVKKKEPHFFGSDNTRHQRHSTTLAQYLSQFDHISGKHRIGEASTGYLSYQSAAQEISDFNPSAQIIIMLRNPIDVLHAIHSQMLFSGMEHISQFELAVDSQQRRVWQFGPWRGEPVLRTGYREVVRFSEQIRRYYDVFGRERVHVILFDDFASAPRLAYENVLSFLGVGSDQKSNFKIVNGNKGIRSRVVQDWLRHLSTEYPRVERSFPGLVRGARAAVAHLNYVDQPRPLIKAEFSRAFGKRIRSRGTQVRAIAR